MAQRFQGQAESTIAAPVSAIWSEAVSLEWLNGWDEVRFDGVQQLRSAFRLYDELRSFTGRFTTFEPLAGTGSPASLAWSVNDGSSGSLFMVPTGTTTRVTWRSVSVPHGVDRIFGLGISLLPGRARRLCDEDCTNELHGLTTRSVRRAGGRLILEYGLVTRQMAAVCPYGWFSADNESLPEFDPAGELRLEPDESVLTTGVAAVLSTAARAAAGREQFQVLWRLGEDRADVILTDRRLVYRDRDTGAAGRSEVFAGHIWHRNVANLIGGDGSAYGIAGMRRLTATLIEPPETAIRIHLLLRDSNELTRAWGSAIARWRIANYPDVVPVGTKSGDVLRSHLKEPQFVNGHWGPMVLLPKACPLGSKKPME